MKYHNFYFCDDLFLNLIFFKINFNFYLTNIKYLKNFKWDYLTEKFAYERRVREQKLKAAMLQSKRTNAEFVELVEKQKAQSHYDERKRKRGDNGDNDNNESKKIRRKFHQNKIIANQHGENERQAVDSRFLKSVWA